MPNRPSKEFNTEKDLCDYLEKNISLFTREIIGEEIYSYSRESQIVAYRGFGSSRPKVDFDISTGNKRVLVECKNPVQVYSELSRAISQLLVYGTIAKEYVELILVTSKTIPIIQQTIINYELPIKVVLLTKNVLAEWDIETEKRLISGGKQVRPYAIS